MAIKLKEIIVIVVLIGFSILIVNIFAPVINLQEDKIDENNNPLLSHNRLDNILDSIEIVKTKVKYNQHLAAILSNYNLHDFNADDIIRKTRLVFDLRKFKAGNYCYAYLSSDSARSLSHFTYKHSITESIEISLLDSLKVELTKKEVDTIQKSVSGVIETSLWQAMLDNNANPNLAVELSDIYAWTIDFFGLTKGDKFKVIYDELYVDSVSIGVGKIYSAIFTHNNTDYYAFAYNQNGKMSYYDDKGNSLRKAFLKSPLKYRRISSRFSYSRFHPILKIRRPHRGVDYAAPSGTPIHSIGEGKVIAKGYTKAAGYYIKIKHNGTYTSGYNHLSKYARGMMVGAKVKMDQVIGYVGSTGYATGPHLDFRIWKNGRLTDPLKVKAPPVEPVKQENFESYTKLKNLMVNLLELI